MAIVTLAEAARLVGKSKPTLLRAHRDGKLSMERNANNEWRVDTSELLRTYGQFTETQQSHSTKDAQSRHATPDSIGLERENETLKRHIESIEETLRRTDETITDLRIRLDTSEQERRDAQKTIQLLTHQQIDTPREKTNIWTIVLITTTVVTLVIGAIYAIKMNVI